MRHLLFACSLCCLTACGPKAPPQPSGETIADTAEAPAMLPTPYTVAQMRQGWVPGTKVEFHIVKRGAPDTVHRWEVLSHPDEDHAETAFSMFREDGQTQVGETRTAATGFDELRRHAEFPAAITTSERATLETSFGSCEGTRYTMVDPQSPGIVRVFEFADDLPGPPLLMRVSVEGTVVDEMVMTARSPLP